MSDALLERAIPILERLIAFDTTSHKSNLAAIDWIAAYLAARGHAYSLVESADGTKSNLYACIGPRREGGVLLSGHSDVVPVDGQPWTSDPWTLTRRDERLYGRGVADMKGFIALVLAALDEPTITGLERPIHIAVTYDEEIGCLGAPGLIARLSDLGPRPALAIIGEPTGMKVVSTHKGIRVFDVVVTGRESHSSLRGHGVSAITEATGLMALIAELDAASQAAVHMDPICDPPGTTLSVGLVEGGTAANILARVCTFRWDLRAPDEAEADRYEARFRERAAEVDRRIKQIAPEGGVAITKLAAAPPLTLQPGSDAEILTRALTGDNATIGAPFVAEGGLYQQAGIPAVLCGPGSIVQAHQPDEWIAIDQLRQGGQFLLRLVESLSR
jgi:acetylornithine deacetylase